MTPTDARAVPSEEAESVLPNSSAPSAAAPKTNGLPWRPYLELTKPRLSFLSVSTALLGYGAARPSFEWLAFLGLGLGTALAAGGALALNQYCERGLDARMARTRKRPLPSGQMLPGHALAFGTGCSLLGIALLGLTSGAWPAVLALITIGSYIGLYTPLKRMTPWATLVGAVPGALPPLIGWTAATGGFQPLGLILFAMLFCWQMPHFHSIGWTYRKDYAQAGMQMLAVVDPSGDKAARQSLVFALLLVGAAIAPSLWGLATWFYGVAALLVGAWFLRPALAFLRPSLRDRAARKLFFASLLCLPLLLFALVADRLFFA